MEQGGCILAAVRLYFGSCPAHLSSGRRRREPIMTADRSLPRVLIGTAIHPSALELLGAQAEVDYRPDLTEPELNRLIGQYEAIIVAAGQGISADLLARAVHLKALARLTAALDHIDIVAAQEHDIHVVNCPDAFSVAVAEHTLGLLLAAARRLPQLAPASSGHLGTGLANKTLGIIGYGRIGREVAIRARAFRMKILVNQKRATPELDLDEDIANVDLPELLQRADFVSLHVPYSPETHHLLGAVEFALMRPSAILLNTSRGPVVDEEALLAALETGRIAGAALDELAAASLPPLASHERVLASPFIAGQTDDAHRIASLDVAEQIIALLADVEADQSMCGRIQPAPSPEYGAIDSFPFRAEAIVITGGAKRRRDFAIADHRRCIILSLICDCKHYSSRLLRNEVLVQIITRIALLRICDEGGKTGARAKTRVPVELQQKTDIIEIGYSLNLFVVVLWMTQNYWRKHMKGPCRY